MTYTIKKTSQFKKSYKLAVKCGLDVTLLEDVINKLKDDIPLEEKFHDHQLSGNMKLFRECHIHPDWLLVYSCRGFNTPPLWGEIKGIKPECNSLAERTIPRTLCVGVRSFEARINLNADTC